jgi:cytochrome b6-f complex iron-sulfur subunit
MPERPSVPEILRRVREGGPARSEEPAPATNGEEEAAPLAEVPAAEATAVEPEPAPAPPPPVAAAPPPNPGRPLTLKEKLAAARNQPAGAAPAAPPTAPAPAAPAAAEAPAAEAPVAPAPAPAPAAAALTPEALGRPLTLKEKLAAARGGAAAAAPAAPASAKPAAAKAAAATAAPAARADSTRPLPPLDQARDPRDLAEHLRRAGAERTRKAAAEVAAKAPATGKAAAPRKAESKVVPPRPRAGTAAAATATAAAPAAVGASRREWFRVGFWIAAGWTTFTAGMAALTAMSLRFFFPNVLAEPPSTIKVGFPADFEKNQVSERWKAEWGFWLVRSDAYDGEDKLYALSTICTHLGCPPNWLAGEQKFKCPCHGSGFYISGVNFEGPAPRPLERFKVTVADDGQITVDKSQKYQEEMGQWADPESYIKA